VTPEELTQRLDDLGKKVDAIYSPGPAEALKQRPRRSFRKRDMSIVLANNGEQVLWTSPILDTVGFTTQNCFAQIIVHADALPASATTLIGVMEGSFDSPLVEIDRDILTYNGRGTYGFQLLRSGASLATQMRFVLIGHTEVPRNLRASIRGSLTAGYSL